MADAREVAVHRGIIMDLALCEIQAINDWNVYYSSPTSLLAEK